MNGQDALGVELYSHDRTRAMAQGHDLILGGVRRCDQVGRQLIRRIELRGPQPS